MPAPAATTTQLINICFKKQKKKNPVLLKFLERIHTSGIQYHAKIILQYFKILSDKETKTSLLATLQ